jgi:cytochrome c oxidase assembly protein subunit 15
MFGGIVPDRWDPKIAIHFAHRLGALVVTLAIVATTTCIWSRARKRREMIGPAVLLVVLVATQVTLGALTVLSRRDPWINSFHVVCGAMVLTTSLVLTLRTWRTWFAGATVRLTPDTTVALRANIGNVRLQADHDPARGRA